MRKPRKYQQRAVEWFVSHGGAGTFAKPGAGKTSVVLRAILALKQAKVLRKALVIAPLRVCHEVWPVEAAEWAGTAWDGLRTLKINVLHGPEKDARLQEDADIYVINPAGLKWLFEDAKRFRKCGFDTLVVDESTLFKNYRTQRFKMLRKILPSFARRWILTGTPTPRGYINLFSQIYVVDMGAALGQYVTHFRFKYFTQINDWTWVLKDGADKEIEAKIAPYIFTLEADDYKEIPVEPNIIRVELPRKARQLYDDMEEEMIVELGNGVVTAAGAGPAAMKCAQIANGGLYHQPGLGPRTWENIHEAKLDAVEELIDELNGSPALIVYDFEHDLARLRGRFPNAPYIGKGVTRSEENKIFAAWNADEIEVLLVQATSISHGLNLQLGSAQDIIWHSITYDLEVYDQLNARLARSGTKHDRIFSHLIVARDTVDDAKLLALRRKDKTQRAFLNALKEYASRRKQA